MLWWAWEERPNTEFMVLEIVVVALDRDPTHVRKPRHVGVEVQVRSREEARALCVSLQRRTGIPVGWPAPAEKVGNWFQEGF